MLVLTGWKLKWYVDAVVSFAAHLIKPHTRRGLSQICLLGRVIENPYGTKGHGKPSLWKPCDSGGGGGGGIKEREREREREEREEREREEREREREREREIEREINTKNYWK